MTGDASNTPAPAQRSTLFDVPKMDCASEEALVRMALQPEAGIRELAFDLDARTLRVRHEGDSARLLARLEPLGFGARVRSSEVVESASTTQTSDLPARGEGRVLRWLLLINATMFLVEFGIGIVARSTGVLADSLDMLADAAVYGVSLYGVGRSIDVQHRAARASGVVQLVLAVGVLAEVLRRAFAPHEPVGALMMAVAFVALCANVACTALLAKHCTGGVHMRASWIFSTNDVIANLGVIIAGALVAATGSQAPDLVIGTLIGLVVLSGAVRILRLART